MNCSLCTFPFHLDERIPRMLPCAHTFCSPCIETFAGERTTVRCPQCIKVVRVPRGGFPRNFQFESLLSEHMDGGRESLLESRAASDESPRQSLKNVCIECSRSQISCDLSDLTHACETCAAFLCTAHAMLHGKLPSTRGHTVHGVEGATCRIHLSSRLDYFCATHIVPVCCDCCVFDHSTCEKLPIKVPFLR